MLCLNFNPMISFRYTVYIFKRMLLFVRATVIDGEKRFVESGSNPDKAVCSSFGKDKNQSLLPHFVVY